MPTAVNDVNGQQGGPAPAAASMVHQHHKMPPHHMSHLGQHWRQHHMSHLGQYWRQHTSHSVPTSPPKTSSASATCSLLTHSPLFIYLPMNPPDLLTVVLDSASRPSAGKHASVTKRLTVLRAQSQTMRQRHTTQQAGPNTNRHTQGSGNSRAPMHCPHTVKHVYIARIGKSVAGSGTCAHEPWTPNIPTHSLTLPTRNLAANNSA